MDAEAKIRVTFEEYAARPETNQIVELIDGEIVTETIVDLSPNAHHNTLVKLESYLRIVVKVGVFSDSPTELHFDDGNSFEPDLFWISPDSDRCFLEDNGRYWHGAPDLVIEVLSPSTEANDRGHKYEIYEKYGVREYWMVDPEARYAEVYRHDGNRFARQGVFKPNQPFVSAVLGDTTIMIESWFNEKS